MDASRGGITISSGPNSLTIGARVQFRWTLDDREHASADTGGSGVADDDGPLSQFDVRRMRVSLRGGMYRPWLRYEFQFDFARTSGEADNKIKDAVIEIVPTGRPYRLAMGQFKAPFGLQQLMSSGRLQFVDRAITDERFNPGRDMGLMFSGTARRQTLGYAVGVFNGSGESRRQNNRSHLLVGRVFAQPLGRYELSESALESTSDPAVHIGAGVLTGKQIRGRTAQDIIENADNQTAVNAEFAFKHGRLFSTAEYFWSVEEQSNPAARPDLHSRGFHLQGGFMLVPARLEAGALVARITPDTNVDDAEVTEVRGVVGYYWQGHRLKLQMDAGRLAYGARFTSLSSRARLGLPSLGPRLVSNRALGDLQVRAQFQLAF